MAVDKPNITQTLAELEAEVGKPEPYVLALKSGKRVTFPDIYDMPAEEGFKFLTDMKDAENDFTVLERWLSVEDYAKYMEAKVSLRLHGAIMSRVQNYYEETVGKPGEDNASAS